MTSFGARAVEKLLRKAPPRLAARVDFFLVPAFRQAWGGPFNGQAARAALVKSILEACPFDAIVETGTHRGTTTEYLRRISNLRVFSVESSPRYFAFSKLRFRHDDGVVLQHGDTRDFLGSLTKTCRDALLFFYLDAHWGGEYPIRRELEIIQSSWSDFVVMVDDFQVPDDPGYAFDDFGPGTRLTLADVPLTSIGGAELFSPSVPAVEETGERRGCAVLARGAPVPALARLQTLRHWGVRSGDPAAAEPRR